VTLTFAKPPDIRVVQALPATVVSGGLPPSGTLPASFRKIFHPAALQAIEGLWHEIETHTLVPLFVADLRKELAETFRLVHPRFAAYYQAAALTLVESLREPALIEEVATFSFDLVSANLRMHGPQYIGREPTIAAMIGVHSVAQVLKAAARQSIGGDLQRQRLEAIAQPWTVTTTSYMLALFAVFVAVTQGTGFAGRWANVATLAVWSRIYASQLYDLSTRGLLQAPPRPPGELPVPSTEADLRLADAGLEDYSDLLRQ
jgi:hypothetical protein